MGNPAYDLEWFRNRALQGIKPTGENSWDYSDSLLLYLPSDTDSYEAIQEVDTPYHNLVTAPEREYLKHIGPMVAAELPDSFEYIDLGPGTEHKEQFLFDSAKELGKMFTYCPVDFNERYLRLATEYASAQSITTHPIESSFEELPHVLAKEVKGRFVSIGLTYGNYDPGFVLTLLKDVAGTGGMAFINAQIRDRIDIQTIREIYATVAYSMATDKLKLIGLDPENDIASTEVTDEIKVWHTLKRSTSELQEKGIEAGDRLLVFQSLRPTLEKLTEDISKVFPNHKILDTGEGFVGALLR